jgi:hypothetical protein
LRNKNKKSSIYTPLLVPTMHIQITSVQGS